MSDDILARLRKSDGGYFMRKMFAEAADEIERLRNELQECEKLIDEYQRADADRTRWEER